MDGSLFLGASTDTMIELSGTAVGDFDQFVVSDDLTLSGDLAVSLINGYELSLGQEFTIFEVTGVLTGSLAGLAEGDVVDYLDGTYLFITYAGGDGNDVVLFTNAAPIPEPSSFLLLGFGVIGLVRHTQRRRRRA